MDIWSFLQSSLVPNLVPNAEPMSINCWGNIDCPLHYIWFRIAPWYSRKARSPSMSHVQVTFVVVSIGLRGEDRGVDEGVVWVIHVIGMHTKSPSADVT